MDATISVDSRRHGAAERPAPIRAPLAGRLLVALAALLAFSVGAASADGAVLQGSVLNKNTQRFLERATVKVQGSELQALTDKNGKFRIAGVPAGTHAVTASYAGLGEATQTVVVTEEGAPNIVFLLTAEDVYQMSEEVVVTSPLEGNAYAINQQRRAESVRTVASIDAFIDQATGNPGEFVKNVHGIQMDYSQNEPQAIRVRGFDPFLTTVTMNGNAIASAASSSTSRTVQIDQLSIASIGNVEVFKAPIPSMSANAIGGVVNFNTISAFEQQGRRTSFQLGTNVDGNSWFSQNPSIGHGEPAERGVYPIGRFAHSDSFFDNKLGLYFSLGHDRTNQLGSSVTHNLNVTGAPAPPTEFTEANSSVRRAAMSLAPNRQLRVRDDVSLNTDYRLGEAGALFLRSTYSYYHSTNRNHSWTLTPATLAAGATATDYTTTNGTAGQNTSVFDKYTKSWQINPGFSMRSGEWKLDASYGFSKSINQYENEDDFGFLSIDLAGLGWSMSTPRDTDTPSSISQTSGPDFYNLNNYKPNQGNLLATGGEQRADHNGIVSTNFRHTWEVQHSARLDVQRDFRTRRPAFLKAGLAYNQGIRDKTQPQKRWYWMGQDGVATADDLTAAGAQLGRFAEPTPVTMGIEGFNLQEPTYFCQTCFFDYWQANPQVLQENLAYSAQQQFVGKRYVDEQVFAAYLMGNATFDKLNVLGGVRLEKTDIQAIGHRVLPTTGTGPDVVNLQGKNPNSLEGILATYRFTESSSSYTSSPFFYLHLKYEWLPMLQTRASYTEAIGRPDYTDILPTLTQNESNQTITTNRAGLLPQSSKNFDFSVEYYTKSAGEWTAGWFRRDVKDYISATTLPMTPELLEELNLGPQYANYQVITKENLGSATWSGYELAFRQQLRDWEFVPDFLNGIELFSNFTHLYDVAGTFGTATAANPAGTEITTLANVVPKIFNAGVSYRSPKGKLFVNLITNYQAIRATQNLPATTAAAQRLPQQESYQFWNLEVSYSVTPKLRLTSVCRNLLSERPTFSEVAIIRNRQQDTGAAWTFMLKLDL